MSTHYKPNSRKLSASLNQKLSEFLAPLVDSLTAQMDRRLVRTLVHLVQTILIFRHQAHGLLLSELGGYLLSPEQAPAGTKRISNLLRSRHWSFQIIERFLWQQGEAAVSRIEAETNTPLCLWDESVLEKSESLALEGLCAVQSSKAARLKRIKPGFFNPPGRPIFVPGMKWLMVMIVGPTLAPTLSAMKWWTTRGVLATDKRTLETTLLRECARRWGQRVVHIWDRGFAGAPWLSIACNHSLRFVLRWQKKYLLTNTHGEKRSAWKMTRGKRSLQFRQIWDARRGCYRKTGIYFTPVFHEAVATPLYLVVSRPGYGRKPWYLLTSEPVTTVEEAWRVVFCYARRWQIEMGFRVAKTELAFESPRLWSWENRLKLLLIASLALAFLFSLLHTLPVETLQDLLRLWCHRTGKRHREVSMPLYRLRSALSRLWLYYPPPAFAFFQNSG